MLKKLSSHGHIMCALFMSLCLLLFLLNSPQDNYVKWWILKCEVDEGKIKACLFGMLCPGVFVEACDTFAVISYISIFLYLILLICVKSCLSRDILKLVMIKLVVDKTKNLKEKFV